METDIPEKALHRRRRPLLSQLASTMLESVLPSSCAGCRRDAPVLCTECRPEMPKMRPPFCEVCARPGAAGVCYQCLTRPPGFDGIRVPFLHEGTARTLVHRLKYANYRVYARTMAELMAECLEEQPVTVDTVVAVPLHGKRERERGYNQSELLARELGQLFGLAVEARALRKSRETEPQVALEKAEERRRNVQGVFACGADMSGKRVLLVDDVVTTGATMSACASALKEAGAEAVWGVAFVRQPPPR
ncbi:MAG: ComF family protein [Chloroflexi bacterium]|nr:ComF family protein [Chloroflexota bacterium]